jgi:8-oxo-dGTP pyrophosphatase MutT (NUDIX family)
MARNLPHPPIRALHRLLAGYRPRPVEPGVSAFRAAVALVVRPAGAELELLLIKRAAFPGDPWSGHMAFPGGRRAEAEEDLETAIRETREEVGLDLERGGLLLGRLDAVQPRAGAPSVAVVPFVFAVEEATGTRTNPEVDRTYWIPLRELRAPGAATEYLHALSSGDHLRFPAIVYDEQVIWGLTHRILAQFLEFAREAHEEEA